MNTQVDHRSRRASLFRNANNLAVRFPADWKIDAVEAEISFDGEVITVRPIAPTSSLADLFREFASEAPDEEPWEDPLDPPAESVHL